MLTKEGKTGWSIPSVIHRGISDEATRKEVFFMKSFTREIRNATRRFATLIATSVVGLTFALVSSVAAAPADKNVIIVKDARVDVKIAKAEKMSKGSGLFDRGRGNVPFFLNAFDKKDLLEEELEEIEEELEEELEEEEEELEEELEEEIED
jgi:hypothetical protein